MRTVNALLVSTRIAGQVAVMMVTFPVGAQTRLDLEVVRVRAAGFVVGESAAVWDGAKQVVLAVDATNVAMPLAQSAVKQDPVSALQGPNPNVPHFAVRFALPIPPDNDTNLVGAAVGLDEEVWAHNHSPGLEVLANGDLLAVYFSARVANGAAESANDTRFIQARLRHGAEQWDLPELFYDLKGCNEQSGLLWKDGNTIRFFGGGRGASDWLPFKMAISTNNGATWAISLPQLDKPASDYTAQPIANAFRNAIGAMYFAMDAKEDESFLWSSRDGGIHWSDMGGRTGGRHSTIVPLDEQGSLLSLGGKNTSLNGWTPMNTSTNWGATWNESQPAPFPALGNNQRPCLIRLANGHLCFVTDSYSRKTGKSPEGWKLGQGCVVAISTNNGATWHMKRLPVELPHEKRENKSGTLGYATARQAPNGVIHVLATMTQPCLHYEFNEAWIDSNAGDVPPESGGGMIEMYRENYPDGSPRVTWSARICPNGRYLLDGVETSYHATGKKEHEVVYASGRKTGEEAFWAPDGTKLWSWNHNLKRNVSIWTHYWPNGQKRIESTWNTKPAARDLKREFFGLVADGPVRQWTEDGTLLWKGSFVNGEFGGKHLF